MFPNYPAYEAVRDAVLRLLDEPRHLTSTAWIKGFFIDDGDTEVAAVDVHFDVDSGRFHVRVNVLGVPHLNSVRAEAFAGAMFDAFTLAEQVEQLTAEFVLAPESRRRVG